VLQLFHQNQCCLVRRVPTVLSLLLAQSHVLTVPIILLLVARAPAPALFALPNIFVRQGRKTILHSSAVPDIFAPQDQKRRFKCLALREHFALFLLGLHLTIVHLALQATFVLKRQYHPLFAPSAFSAPLLPTSRSLVLLDRLEMRHCSRIPTIAHLAPRDFIVTEVLLLDLVEGAILVTTVPVAHRHQLHLCSFVLKEASVPKVLISRWLVLLVFSITKLNLEVLLSVQPALLVFFAKDHD
jgi:hypothetical protein